VSRLRMHLDLADAFLRDLDGILCRPHLTRRSLDVRQRRVQRRGLTRAVGPTQSTIPWGCSITFRNRSRFSTSIPI